MDAPPGTPEVPKELPLSTKQAHGGLVDYDSVEIEENGHFWWFFSVLTVFQSFFNFGSILAQELNRFVKKKSQFFDSPETPELPS